MNHLIQFHLDDKTQSSFTWALDQMSSEHEVFQKRYLGNSGPFHFDHASNGIVFLVSSSQLSKIFRLNFMCETPFIFNIHIIVFYSRKMINLGSVNARASESQIDFISIYLHLCKYTSDEFMKLLNKRKCLNQFSKYILHVSNFIE